MPMKRGAQQYLRGATFVGNLNGVLLTDRKNVT